jgi:hypothetical protein
VAVEDFQRAIGELTAERGLGGADLGEKSLQGVALDVRISPPMDRCWLKLSAGTRRGVLMRSRMVTINLFSRDLWLQAGEPFTIHDSAATPFAVDTPISAGWRRF